MLQRIGRALVRLNGYPQEYLCLDADAMTNAFSWEIDGRTMDPKEILFCGYGPLVLGFAAGRSGRSLELRQEGRRVATLRLRPLESVNWTGIEWMGAERPWQHFLPSWAEPLDRLRQAINARQPGNVTKSMRDYDLLRIAYAQPREIHLAVVGPPDRCNVFPTDLHGPVGEEGYVISLRHANKACAQVQAAGEVLLCRMRLDRYRAVYGLARRHGAELERAAGITAIDGEALGHALPAGALDTQHLLLEDHADVGIHRLLRFRVVERRHLAIGPVLAHAHAAPLGLLKRSGRPVEVLLR